MNCKIVVDSSADLAASKNKNIATAPLEIIIGEEKFSDNKKINVAAMMKTMKAHKGKSSTSCPSVKAWLDAFKGAQNIFCITITSALSGSYNSACVAAKEYKALNPNANICVIDSLSTGAEIGLAVDWLLKNAEQRDDFVELSVRLKKYMSNTGLIFMLKSLENLAKNGRVPLAVAKIAGILGIRVVGKASEKGELKTLAKVRGDDAAIASVLENMEKTGFQDGKVKISHCFNKSEAKALKNLILQKYKNAQIEIYEMRGLCSFYAENGGIIVGYEKSAV